MANDWLNSYDKNWMSGYDQIDYESDAHDDFYDEAMTSVSRWDSRARGSLLCSAWSRGRVQKSASEDVVREMMEIRTSVHNLLKVQVCPGSVLLPLPLSVESVKVVQVSMTWRNLRILTSC